MRISQDEGSICMSLPVLNGEIPQLIITPPLSEELISRSASGALLTLKETQRPD